MSQPLLWVQGGLGAEPPPRIGWESAQPPFMWEMCQLGKTGGWRDAPGIGKVT